MAAAGSAIRNSNCPEQHVRGYQRGVPQVLRVLRRAAAQERLDDACRGPGVVAGKRDVHPFRRKSEIAGRVGFFQQVETGPDELE